MSQLQSNLNITEIELSKIKPSPFQPRGNFENEEIEKLANSINLNGLLQPILVSKTEKDIYQIIAGERRWRAFHLLNRETIPCIIHNVSPAIQSVESLVENVHRKELHITEKAKGLLEILKAHNIETKDKGKLITSFYRIVSNSPIDNTDFTIKELLEKLSIQPSTAIIWLKAISVDEEILKTEAVMKKNEKTPGSVLSRLSTIEDRELQKKTYTKIREVEDDLSISEKSKFISALKKMPEEKQKIILKEGIKIDVSPMGEVTPIITEETHQSSLLEWNMIEDELDHVTVNQEIKKLEENYTSSQLDIVRKQEEQRTETVTKHVDKVPKQELHFERALWNIQRFADSPDFFTVGTDGKKSHHFYNLISSIIENSTRNELILVDVRDTPYSRFKPDFNKNYLIQRAKAIGFEYKLIKKLGVNKRLRDKLFSNEISEQQLWAVYEETILTIDLKKEIMNIIETKRRPIFMCTELSPLRCHRHVIANWLEREHNLKGWDL